MTAEPARLGSSARRSGSISSLKRRSDLSAFALPALFRDDRPDDDAALDDFLTMHVELGEHQRDLAPDHQLDDAVARDAARFIFAYEFAIVSLFALQNGRHQHDGARPLALRVERGEG